MKNIGGTVSSEWTDSRSHFVEDHVPSSALSKDSYGHSRRVRGFRNDDVKLEVGGRATTTRDETLARPFVYDDSRYKYLNDDRRLIHQKYKLPVSLDRENITAKFDDGIPYVTVPKKDETTFKEPEYQENGTATTTSDENHHQETLAEKTSMDDQKLEGSGGATTTRDETLAEKTTPLERAFEMMKKNKGILLTAVLAFSLGIIVTRHRLESGGE